MEEVEIEIDVLALVELVEVVNDTVVEVLCEVDDVEMLLEVL